jgi:hypothetical protein
MALHLILKICKASIWRNGNTNVSFIPWDTASHQDYDTVRPLSYPGTVSTKRFVFNIWFASHWKHQVSLCCLFFFEIRILIAPLVSSNIGNQNWIKKPRKTDTKNSPTQMLSSSVILAGLIVTFKKSLKIPKGQSESVFQLGHKVMQI